MKTEIVLVKPGERITSSLVSTDPPDKDGFENLRTVHAPVVGLVDLEKFESLLMDSSLFFNCGVKHEDKPLSYYNKCPARFQLINGMNFTGLGKVMYSIEVFFKRNKQPDLFVLLGVNKAILDEAREQITSEPVIVHHRKKKFDDPVLDIYQSLDYPLDLDRVFVGSNEASLKVKQLIAKAAASDLPVLILGDTGTGKEIIAREIHKYSSRGKQGHEMITINCAGIPNELFDSEIFGHEPNVFTDGIYLKIGKWEKANHSTLFLDEFGDLTLHNQAKLLRVLEDKSIYRLGGLEPIPVDVRIIAATNKDILTMASSRKPTFRLDLYHRVAKFIIHTQPLSCHSEDIPEIAQHLWRIICQNESASLSPEVLNRLREHYWPGNVRSLKHFLERIDALFGREGIEIQHINSLILDEISNYINPPHLAGLHPLEEQHNDNFVQEIQQVESLLKIARKTQDKDKLSLLLRQAQDWLTKLADHP